ncbi:MAG: HepT-like ribonuclease domain-containing protein, partial [archaeon]|nr:HepT-like ribonuclease domain-containing protein [archaeon]
SDELKEKYPEIQWKRISGLRDILIHVYFGIDLERIWVVVKDDLPDLKKKIKAILDSLEKLQF